MEQLIEQNIDVDMTKLIRSFILLHQGRDGKRALHLLHWRDLSDPGGSSKSTSKTYTPVRKASS